MSLLGKEWYGEFIAHKDGFKEGVEEGFKIGYETAKKEFAEHKTGKWIDHSEDGYVECPLCGHLTTCEGNIEDLHYCYWCGSKMEVDGKDGRGRETMNRNIPKFYVCDEMQKLRDGLTERGIEWEDLTEKDTACWICRTHYTYNKNMWSVVHGFGSYGGFSHFSKDAELLECMYGGNEPVGWLTAADVFKMMEVDE